MSSLKKYLKKRIILTISMIIFFIGLLVISYKIFNKSPISVTYTSNGNKVNLLNYLETDLNKIPVNVVKLTNNSDKVSKIKLRVVEDNNYINNLTKTKYSYMIDDGEIKNIDESGVLASFELLGKTTKEVDIRIWIREYEKNKNANLVFYIESTK